MLYGKEKIKISRNFKKYEKILDFFIFGGYNVIVVVQSGVKNH